MVWFIEKTWLFWWVVACVIILRWFYVVSHHCEFDPAADGDDETRDVVDSLDIRRSRKVGA
jgi:hypothetical protein